jgi:hypothetical protein
MTKSTLGKSTPNYMPRHALSERDTLRVLALLKNPPTGLR